MDIYQNATDAAQWLNDRFQEPFQKALITGTGGTQLLEAFEIIDRVAFQEIPHLVSSTYLKGEFLSCQFNGQPILIIHGRLHYYEGYSAAEVSFPIRILKQLGISELLMTNASGGLNPDYAPGEIVLVKDHINLMPEHPLRGPNDERFGLRFPDMSNAYDAELRTQIQIAAQKALGRPLQEGVYVGFQGPSLETPAEYKYLNMIGADMTGMSTVPEVIVANHCSIKTAVLSIVTNICYPPEVITETTLEEVVEMAERVTQEVMVPVVVGWLQQY